MKSLLLALVTLGTSLSFGAQSHADQIETFNLASALAVVKCSQSGQISSACELKPTSEVQQNISIPMSTCNSDSDKNTLCGGTWYGSLQADGQNFAFTIVAEKLTTADQKVYYSLTAANPGQTSLLTIVPHTNALHDLSVFVGTAMPSTKESGIWYVPAVAIAPAQTKPMTTLRNQLRLLGKN